MENSIVPSFGYDVTLEGNPPVLTIGGEGENENDRVIVNMLLLVKLERVLSTFWEQTKKNVEIIMLAIHHVSLTEKAFECLMDAMQPYDVRVLMIGHCKIQFDLGLVVSKMPTVKHICLQDVKFGSQMVRKGAIRALSCMYKVSMDESVGIDGALNVFTHGRCVFSFAYTPAHPSNRLRDEHVDDICKGIKRDTDRVCLFMDVKEPRNICKILECLYVRPVFKKLQLFNATDNFMQDDMCQKWCEKIKQKHKDADFYIGRRDEGNEDDDDDNDDVNKKQKKDLASLVPAVAMVSGGTPPATVVVVKDEKDEAEDMLQNGKKRAKIHSE